MAARNTHNLCCQCLLQLLSLLQLPSPPHISDDHYYHKTFLGIAMLNTNIGITVFTARSEAISHLMRLLKSLTPSIAPLPGIQHDRVPLLAH